MKYTKNEIGKELKNELRKGYDVERISNWARDTSIIIEDEKLDELNFILNRISLMWDDPKFEYTLEELNVLIEMLIEEVENPIKRLDEIRHGKCLKPKIGTELRRALEKSYNVEKISNWADNAIINLRSEQPELCDILSYIALMEAGPEFEYTKEELNSIATMLIREEENPIQRINNMHHG